MTRLLLLVLMVTSYAHSQCVYYPQCPLVDLYGATHECTAVDLEQNITRIVQNAHDNWNTVRKLSLEFDEQIKRHNQEVKQFNEELWRQYVDMQLDHIEQERAQIEWMMSGLQQLYGFYLFTMSVFVGGLVLMAIVHANFV